MATPISAELSRIDAALTAPLAGHAPGRWQNAASYPVKKRASAMQSFLLKLFTWWNSQTFGTQFWTWLYGEAVGEDEFGNRYFRTRGGKIDPTLGVRAALGDL